MNAVSVRHIVDDVEAAMSFYSRHLGLELEDPAGNPIELFEPPKESHQT